MKKTINDMTPQELIQLLIPPIGNLIKAEVQTMATIIKAETKAIVKEAEERIRKDMATKDDIKDMATKDDIKDMATKQDIQRLEEQIKKLDSKMDKKFDSHEERLEKLEQAHTLASKN